MCGDDSGDVKEIALGTNGDGLVEMGLFGLGGMVVFGIGSFVGTILLGVGLIG